MGTMGEFTDTVVACGLSARADTLTLVWRLDSCAMPLDTLSTVTALPRDRGLDVKMSSTSRPLTAAGPATGKSH